MCSARVRTSLIYSLWNTAGVSGVCFRPLRPNLQIFDLFPPGEHYYLRVAILAGRHLALPDSEDAGTGTFRRG